jgi:hypothetical protein
MEYIVTGTRAYGPVSEDSDLDIVVLRSDSEEIKDFLVKHNIEIYQSENQIDYDIKTGTGGFYFNILGIQINIICANDKDYFEDWKKRTEEMQKIEPIKDREKRIHAFNNLIKPFRMMIPIN